MKFMGESSIAAILTMGRKEYLKEISAYPLSYVHRPKRKILFILCIL